MSDITNKKSFPTAFIVFTAQHTLAEKRFMKKVCDVVQASTGLAARSKWNPLAGECLNAEGKAAPVAGFNVLIEVEQKTDRLGVRQLFWRPETLLPDGEFNLLRVPARAKSIGPIDIETTTPEAVIALLIGDAKVKTPANWAEKEAEAQQKAEETGEKKLERLAKKAARALKLQEYYAGVAQRKLERAAKKEAKAVAATKPVVLSPAVAAATGIMTAPVLGMASAEVIDFIAMTAAEPETAVEQPQPATEKKSSKKSS
jgi:hypothetical protein